MKYNKKALLYFSTVVLSFASDLDYNFNYFGNLTFNSLDKSGYEYRHFQSDDIDDSISYEAYSKLGGQINLHKGNVDFIAQATVRRYKDANEIDLNWLNLKYTYQDLSLRAGRMQLPLFLQSNSLDIDYIHLWAKAPIEVYGIFPIKSYNGLELLYQKAFNNNVYLDIQVTPFGSISEDVDMIESFGEVKAKLDDIKNIMLNLEIDNFTIKSSYTSGNLNIPLEGTSFDQLKKNLDTLGFSELSNKYSFENKKLEFFSLGIDYNNDKFIFNSEIVQMKSDSFLPNNLSYYALAGYRINKWTPFIMYAENKNDKDHYTEDELTTQNPFLTSSVAALKTGLEQELYKMNSSQKTSSIGLRYDLKKGIAVKIQFDRITTKNYGTPNTDGNYSRLGFLAHERSVSNRPVYLSTFSLGFAF
jgi:hypothetical protein